MGVFVGMCTGGDVKAQTVHSLIGLFSTSRNVRGFSIKVGGYKPFNMNTLVEEAKQIEGVTHLLSIDCDMIFPPETLDKLLEADKDIMSVNYLARGSQADQNSPYSVLKFADEKGNYVRKEAKDFPTELFQCAAVGLGFTLIKMEVFDKMEKPYFKTEETPNLATEDIVFCRDAIAAGFEVWVDPTIKMGHIGQYVY